MGRTILSPTRSHGFLDLYIGNVIIFCEGKTEKLYFDYFSDIIKKSTYTNIKVYVENTSGNARRTLDYANNFMAQAENNIKYSEYQKYLAFDCDGDKDIQNIICEALNSNFEYSLLISNLIFETWLLMHFENVDVPMGKRAIYTNLSGHLHSKKYKKARKGLIREIIQNGNVELAIDNAKKLQKAYADKGFTILSNIKTMNPYTNVHDLIEQLMITISKTA